MNVLLVEPGYKNKYPPLGLMKIAAFHKRRGDHVVFVKGLNKDLKSQIWDRIYLSTLFGFYWDATVAAINYYRDSVKKRRKFFIGGPMATLMSKELEESTGVTVIKGLLNRPGQIKLKREEEIDSIIPNYKILGEVDYEYPVHDAYLAYMTRGCVRKCPFCAVPIIEPEYSGYVPLKEKLQVIAKKYGEKKDLMLLDNNVLASDSFSKIIDEIVESGFYKGAKLGKRNRYVDFNQGIDLRLLTKEKMAQLARLPIKPLRIAFDHYSLKDSYIQKVEWAAEYGLLNLSNYILYNFKDTPREFYERLKVNIELNERLGTKIFSFPMKYVPLTAKDRKFVGENWTPKYLRGIKCVLQATHGVVGPKRKFFEYAFGSNFKEFLRLLLLPEDYIIYRAQNEQRAIQWAKEYDALSEPEVKLFNELVLNNKFDNPPDSLPRKVQAILLHYHVAHARHKKHAVPGVLI